MSTHIGKIGRLAKERREELGERMEDGQTGKELAEWLNSLPEVQALLKAKFGGLPVNEQNVSNWRQSGHKDWLRLREARARVLRLVEDAEELSAVARGHRMGDCLAAILAVELMMVWPGRCWAMKRRIWRSVGNVFVRCTGRCRGCGGMMTGSKERS